MAKKTAPRKVTDEPDYPKIINRRLDQLRFSLEDHKVEAIAVSFLPNIRYLTNFSGSNAIFFILEDELHFITDDSYEEQIKEELYKLPNLHFHITRSPWEYIAKKKVLKGVQSIAFEADKMPYSEAVAIRNVIRPLKFKPAENLVTRFTQPKDPDELNFIKKSIEISRGVYEYMLGFIKPGMSEKDISNELCYQCRKNGSEGEPSEIIVVSGERSSLVNGNPTDRKIKKNDLIIMDFGSKVNGFGPDISRTVSIGKIGKEQKLMYDLIRKAQQIVLKEVRPGMNGKYLDSVVRNFFKKEGYENSFKHTVGHGVGLRAIENPIISYELGDQIIPEDCVISIEPGLYMQGKFGIRMDELILITVSGGSVLSAPPDEIDVI